MFPTEEPTSQTQGPVFDTEPQKPIRDTESRSSIQDTDSNVSIFGTPVIPSFSAPVTTTLVAPTYRGATVDKSTEIQKIPAQ